MVTSEPDPRPGDESGSSVLVVIETTTYASLQERELVVEDGVAISGGDRLEVLKGSPESSRHLG